MGQLGHAPGGPCRCQRRASCPGWPWRSQPRTAPRSGRPAGSGRRGGKGGGHAVDEGLFRGRGWAAGQGSSACCAPTTQPTSRSAHSRSSRGRWRRRRRRGSWPAPCRRGSRRAPPSPAGGAAGGVAGQQQRVWGSGSLPRPSAGAYGRLAAASAWRRGQPPPGQQQPSQRISNSSGTQAGAPRSQRTPGGAGCCA